MLGIAIWEFSCHRIGADPRAAIGIFAMIDKPASQSKHAPREDRAPLLVAPDQRHRLVA